MHLLQHLLPYLPDLDDRHFSALLEFIAGRFECSSLHLVLGWVESRHELALPCLQSVHSAQSRWLQACMSRSRAVGDHQLASDDPVLEQIVECYEGRAPLDSITPDPEHPNRSTHVDLIIKLLQSSPTTSAPLPLLIALLRQPDLSPARLSLLAPLTIRCGHLKAITAALTTIPHFPQASSWLALLLLVAPLEVVSFLEECVGHDDGYWVGVSRWLAEHPACLKNISSAIVARITALDSIPPAFFIRYVQICLLLMRWW